MERIGLPWCGPCHGVYRNYSASKGYRGMTVPPSGGALFLRRHGHIHRSVVRWGPRYFGYGMVLDFHFPDFFAVGSVEMLIRARCRANRLHMWLRPFPSRGRCMMAVRTPAVGLIGPVNATGPLRRGNKLSRYPAKEYTPPLRRG